MRLLLLLAFTTFLCTGVRAQKKTKPWTDTDAAEYARRANDSTSWDKELFKLDLEYAEDLATYPLGLNGQPSPVPAYDWGYVSSRPLELEVTGKRITGHSLAYAYDEYRIRPAGDTAAYYGTACNLLFLTDAGEEDPGNNMIVSRNAPHYLATGRMATSIGAVEWVQMQLADGSNFVIIAQRYFDLRQGRTILVAPQKDGSLRFLQLAVSPEGMRTLKDGKAANKEALRTYYASLLEDERVVPFFMATGNL